MPETEPDVIERAAAEMASTFSKLRPIDSTIDEEETAWGRAMRDAIRVVLADLHSDIGVGSICQAVVRDYAERIGVKMEQEG